MDGCGLRSRGAPGRNDPNRMISTVCRSPATRIIEQESSGDPNRMFSPSLLIYTGKQVPLRNAECTVEISPSVLFFRVPTLLRAEPVAKVV